MAQRAKKTTALAPSAQLDFLESLPQEAKPAEPRRAKSGTRDPEETGSKGGGTRTTARTTAAPNRRLSAVAQPRFRVPDLSPRDREALRGLLPRFAFVAESPHVNEIAPEAEADRRPLCGQAGKAWWKALSETLEGQENDEVSLGRLLAFCRKHRIAVMNAVQYPLDPKIARVNPDAEPVRNLGFSKETGPSSYKKLKDSDAMKWHVESLRERLAHPSLAGAKIWCLGNDALWFVERALGADAAVRIAGKIPHPSAWWRNGGAFEEQALAKLREIFPRR